MSILILSIAEKYYNVILSVHFKPKAVTKELTNGLEIAANIETKSDDNAKDSNTASGATLNWSSVIFRCSKLYPELFNPTVENTR